MAISFTSVAAAVWVGFVTIVAIVAERRSAWLEKKVADRYDRRDECDERGNGENPVLVASPAVMGEEDEALDADDKALDGQQQKGC